MAGTISRGMPVQHNYVYIEIHVGIHVGIERERSGAETRGRRLSEGSEAERKWSGSRKGKGFPLQSPPPLDEH